MSHKHAILTQEELQRRHVAAAEPCVLSARQSAERTNEPPQCCCMSLEVHHWPALGEVKWAICKTISEIHRSESPMGPQDRLGAESTAAHKPTSPSSRLLRQAICFQIIDSMLTRDIGSVAMALPYAADHEFVNTLRNTICSRHVAAKSQ